MEANDVKQILDKLNLPKDQYMVNGSGAMLMQGITEIERGRPIGDLDIFCATRLWFDLLMGYHQMQCEYGWTTFTPNPEDERRRCDPPYLIDSIDGIEVNIFFAWRWRMQGNFDVNGLIRNAVMVDDKYPCAGLGFILAWKREVRRPKDIQDIAVLENYLGYIGSTEPLP